MRYHFARPRKRRIFISPMRISDLDIGYLMIGAVQDVDGLDL